MTESFFTDLFYYQSTSQIHAYRFTIIVLHNSIAWYKVSLITKSNKLNGFLNCFCKVFLIPSMSIYRNEAIFLIRPLQNYEIWPSDSISYQLTWK